MYYLYDVNKNFIGVSEVAYPNSTPVEPPFELYIKKWDDEKGKWVEGMSDTDIEMMANEMKKQTQNILFNQNKIIKELQQQNAYLLLQVAIIQAGSGTV